MSAFCRYQAACLDFWKVVNIVKDSIIAIDRKKLIWPSGAAADRLNSPAFSVEVHVVTNSDVYQTSGSDSTARAGGNSHFCSLYSQNAADSRCQPVPPTNLVNRLL
jgi:hypothetical protein